MMNFEGLKGIFNLLKVKHTPKKHWIDSTIGVLLNWWTKFFYCPFIHNAINAANFLFVNVDEVITLDNTSWISQYLYAIQVWNWIPFLVCVEKFDVQGTIDNVFQLCCNPWIPLSMWMLRIWGWSSSLWGMIVIKFSKVLELV